MSFAIGDFAGPDRVPVEGTVPVAFTGIVPDMFAEGRDVIIEGRYVDGTLQAQHDHDQLSVEVRAQAGRRPRRRPAQQSCDALSAVA